LILKWFVATIILKCEVDGKPTTPGEWTCVEQIHLIRGSNRNDAYEKALSLGKSQETSYQNAEGKAVTWKFTGLENLEELASKRVRDGIEVWGRIFHTENPEAFTPEKEGLSVFYEDELLDVTATEILASGIETKLVCNRVKS
jgi:hypothetical protein